MKPTQFRFQVLGKNWTLRLMKRKKYREKNGETFAVTVFHKRRIDLAPDGRDLETITHELVHAYIHELCIATTNEMTVDDMEEVFCELMARRGRELLDLADSLHARIHAPAA